MKYEYKLIRSPRKSISVSISNQNEITVRCSWTLPKSEIIKFLDKKSEWIEKVVERNACRLAYNDDVIEHRSVYLNGKKLPLLISETEKITPEAVCVKKLENVEKLYKKECSAAFLKAVDEISDLVMIKPASVGIRKYRGRWGCCDSRNNLMFNYMVFMLPEDVRRYVIVHELCHVLCHNHSQAFWKLVSDYEPDYKELKKRLAGFDFLTQIY